MSSAETDSANKTMNKAFAETQVISKRTRRDRSRTSVIGLLQAIGIDGAFKEHFVDVTNVGEESSDRGRGNSANFETVEIISRSPNGTVIKAFDRNVARTVAMKVLLSPTEVPEDKVLRFVHEAQLTGQLEHPNIVPVHEIGVDSSGNVYYVMKFVKGTNLQKVIEKLAAGDPETIKEFPLSRLLGILKQVADAVAFAHSRRVLHRDLKPENIMLGDFGEVLVVDWGLGKLVDDDEMAGAGGDDHTESVGPLATVRRLEGDEDVFATMDGVFMGTPAYMAPEQANSSTELGTCSDVYALGGILYAMLTLRPPIQSKDLEEIMRSKLRGAVTPPTAFNGQDDLPHCPHGRVPEALSAVALRALSLKPADRYGSVTEFREELDRYREGMATNAEDAGSLRLAYLMFMRHRERILALLIFGIVVLGVAGVAGHQVVQANREARVALLRAAGIGDQIARRSFDTVDPAAAFLAQLEGLQTKLDEANPQAAPVRMSARFLDSGNWEMDLSNNSTLQDLSPLIGLNVEVLFLANTGVSDLSALKDLPIRRLVLAGSPVADLAPLLGLPLQELNIGGTAVSDLTGLQMLPLVRLNLASWRFQDVSGLAKHPTLKAVLLAKQIDPEPLRSCPQLEFLSHTDWSESAASFWAARESGE